MIPDRFGSDADYDSYYGRDWSLDQSREDWCDEHQQRQTTCAKCVESGALNADGELVRAVTAHLSKMSVKGAA